MEVRGWIDGDESGREMLSRLLTDRPYMHLPPPFHKLPVRVGNVVELVGPSPSAKTTILMHSAIDCILPQFWNGVHYGGFGHLVFFIDLDCRFDVLRLSHMLKNRIILANRSSNCNAESKSNTDYDEELFLASMKRFIYIRCYDSFEFLATLKTLHHQLQKEKDAQGIRLNFMMIDSIGAFHWTDRSSMSLNCQDNNR
ncbi:DNA repair protein XRCC2 homolog isoform X2 [Euphorbia lathyris]